MLWGGTLFIIGGILYAITFSYPDGQVLYLQGLTIGLMALSLLSCYQAWKLKQKTTPKKAAGEISYRRVLLVILMGVLYVLLMPYLGFIGATLAFLIFCMWILGFHRVVPIISISIGCTAVLYVGFQIGLGVPLPTGLLA